MQEIITAVTYLLVWFFCQDVLEIENGLINLIISVGTAIAVYVAIAIYQHKKKE